MKEDEEQKRKGTRVATITFCVVSVGGSTIFKKMELKTKNMTEFCNQTKVFDFLSDNGIWVMSYLF